MTSHFYVPVSNPRLPSHRPRKAPRRGHVPPVPIRDASPLSSEEWTRLHLTLGVCPQKIEPWFEQTDELLRARYQVALKEQASQVSLGDYSLLHDPIEDDARWREAFEETDTMLSFELELDAIGDGPGFCLQLWELKAHILLEEFGLVWFSPAQMNPLMRFA